MERIENDHLRAIYKKLVIDMSMINQLANYNEYDANHILKNLDNYNIRVDIKIERDVDDFGESFKILGIFDSKK